MVYVGGSHGGFIGGHLISSQNVSFKASVLRNPVTNISSMFGVTDIPDWCLVESGAFSSADVERMYKVSPISKIDKVKTPVLLLLGDSDKRVPNSQGIQYYKALKDRNVDVEIKMYPKTGHALTKIEIHSDGWINTVLFFNKYLQK